MVKEIQLSKNMGVTLVDDEDYELFKIYTWWLRNDGSKYAITDIKINGKCKRKSLHRLIMNEPEGFEIDHIDHNGLNNQKSNLRIVTHQQNMMNKRGDRQTSSKFRGVHWFRRDKLWVSQISKNKKIYCVGRFINEEDAAVAYNKKATELFGEYAYLNVID